MPKRFTDSEKFRDNWYRKLSPKHKCLWEYMLSECSIAGILEVDYDSMTFHIGDEIKDDDLKIFSNKFYWITEDKIFIPNFIIFQQKTLSDNNKAHKNIIETLEKYNIPTSLDMSGFESPLQAPSKGLLRGTGNSIGKGKGKGISNSKNINEVCDMETAKDMYNSTAHKLNIPKCHRLSLARQNKLKQRLKDCGGIEGWRMALENLEKSNFCQGDNDRGWKADIDFILQEKSFIKLMEGSYSHGRITKSDRVRDGLQEWVDGL